MQIILTYPSKPQNDTIIYNSSTYADQLFVQKALKTHQRACRVSKYLPGVTPRNPSIGRVGDPPFIGCVRAADARDDVNPLRRNPGYALIWAAGTTRGVSSSSVLAPSLSMPPCVPVPSGEWPNHVRDRAHFKTGLVGSWSIHALTI